MKKIYGNWTWDLPADRDIYLTFDDGPHPEATPFVMEQLAAHEGRGTFFCVGNNCLKYPALTDHLVSEGHRLANHTHTHLNGSRASTTDYLQDVEACQEVLNRHGQGIDLFRPPYGRLKLSQARSLARKYRIIMWDYLIGDFDQALSPEKCLRNALSHIRPGSIVIFHDSTKALSRLKFVLPRYLDTMSEMGLTARVLPDLHRS